MSKKDSVRKADRTLDCIGLYCPMPVLETKQEMDKLSAGETLEVLADDLAAEEDIRAWAKRAGQKILEIEKTSEGLRFLILKQK